MSQDSSSNQLLDPVKLGSWIYQRSHIWQMNLLTAKELAEFATKHGLPFYREEHINHLWKLGLLRADLIVSSQEVDEVGLICVGQEEESFIYADARPPQPFQDTASVPLEDAQAVSPALTMYFHPFRFAVLRSLELLVPSITPVQLLYPQLYKVQKMLEIYLRMIQSAQNNFQGTQYWNDVVSLLVATEPCFYQRIFQHLHIRLLQTRPTLRGWSQGNDPDPIGDASSKAIREEITQHWNEVAKHYRTLDEDRLKQVHQNLCVQIRTLDSNTEAHTLLRLANERLRLNLEGPIGGAMLLQTMAEVLRRAIEEVFLTQLQEEDEWPDHTKENLFGSKRLFDGDRNAVNELLRQRGLGYGPRLRWYVEGETEFYGLNDFFKTIRATDIEILNLRGHIVQKNGLAFRESLRSDIRMGIFSFVSIDKDVAQNFQAVRAAAQQDHICGCFFVSSPDFEFANFDLSELQEIIWNSALERGSDETKKSIFLSLTSSARKGSTFIQGVERAASDIHELWDISKGEEWGKRLMQYALSHPNRLNGKVRLCVGAIRQAFTSRKASYNYSRLHYRVDPQTGQPIKRDRPMTNQERSREI